MNLRDSAKRKSFPGKSSRLSFLFDYKDVCSVGWLNLCCFEGSVLSAHTVKREIDFFRDVLFCYMRHLMCCVLSFLMPLRIKCKTNFTTTKTENKNYIIYSVLGSPICICWASWCLCFKGVVSHFCGYLIEKNIHLPHLKRHLPD